jgi:hypothetical protein
LPLPFLPGKCLLLPFPAGCPYGSLAYFSWASDFIFPSSLGWGFSFLDYHLGEKLIPSMVFYCYPGISFVFRLLVYIPNKLVVGGQAAVNDTWSFPHLHSKFKKLVFGGKVAGKWHFLFLIYTLNKLVFGD